MLPFFIALLEPENCHTLKECLIIALNISLPIQYKFMCLGKYKVHYGCWGRTCVVFGVTFRDCWQQSNPILFFCITFHLTGSKEMIDNGNDISEQAPTCAIYSTRLRNGIDYKEMCGDNSSNGHRKKESAATVGVIPRVKSLRNLD